MNHELIRFWRAAYGKFEVRVGDELSTFSIPGFSDPLLSVNFLLKLDYPTDLISENLSSFVRIESLDQETKNFEGWKETRRFFLGVSEFAPDPARLKSFGAVKKVPYSSLQSQKIASDVHVSTPADNLLLERLASATFSTDPLISILPMASAITRQDFWKILREVHTDDLPFLEKFLPFVCQQQCSFFTIFIQRGRRPIGLLNIGFAEDIGFAMSAAVLPNYRSEGVGRELFAAARVLARQQSVEKIVFWTKHPQLLAQASRAYRYTLFERCGS